MKSTFSTSLILIGLIFFWSAALGQSKFAFSTIVAPFYGHTKTTATVILPADDGSGTLTSQVWQSESSPKGFWVGLSGRYSFSQKWSASTGLWVMSSRFKTSTSKSRSTNFSIPVMANFQASDKKLSPYFSAGALWNFRSTSHLSIPDFGTVILKSDDNTTSRISPMVGAGAIYHFNQRLSLVAQPTYSYTIPPSDFKTRAYQLSLNVQLMFKL